MIGRTLDRYRIESKIGEGGMGVVYKARDLQLDRTVAIKVLPHDKVADPDRRQRFVQEAKAASALNHPGIVTMHDIRSDAGIDFMVMEYVEGKTLDQIIPASGLAPAPALRYVIAIVDALAKAHAAGIVHRDLKPANVIVTADDRVKILDFGLAKLLESPEGAGDRSTMASPLTEPGMVLGTASYMSPEQAEGRPVDARSDIFSLGAMLYEMVTGRKAFAGDSNLKVLTQVLTAEPTPPRQIAPSISLDLEKIIVRCLRKDPARRYLTAADLKVALEDAAHESTTRVEAPGPRRRWMWPAVATVLILVVATAVVLRRGSTTTERSELLQPVPFTALPGVERAPSFSPDGNHVVFSWNGAKQDNRDIYAQQVGSGAPLRLTTDPGNDYNPVWSPDGKWIAFLRGAAETGPNQLRLVPSLGGPERKLADTQPRTELIRSLSRLAWCPDSSCLLVTDSVGDGLVDALFVVSLESGERRQLTDPRPGYAADTEPTVSPDGGWLLFHRSLAPYEGELFRVRLDPGMVTKGEPSRLTERELDANSPAWLPDGREIVFVGGSALWRLALDGRSVPVRLAFAGDDCVMPAISRPPPGQSARLVYVRSYTDQNIWRLNVAAAGVAATAPPALEITSTRIEISPQISPDGRHVVFSSSRSGPLEIWTADIDGGNAVQLTTLGVVPGFPTWSPDGQLIAFHANYNGRAEIFVIPAAGGKPRNITANPAVDTFPSFSRDGRWVYFSSSRNGTSSTIWKVPVEGGAATQVTQVTDRNPTLAVESVDGTSLYYVDTFNGPSALWQTRLVGGPAVKVVERLVNSSFAILTGGIYYVDRAPGPGAVDQETELQYIDFVTRRTTTIARDLGDVRLGFSSSADGRTILFARADSSVDDLMLVEHFR